VKHKFIPLEKQSKRKQRAYHETQRKDWGGFSPVTRNPANPKAYDRKKSGQSKSGRPDSACYMSRDGRAGVGIDKVPCK